MIISFEERIVGILDFLCCLYDGNLKFIVCKVGYIRIKFFILERLFIFLDGDSNFIIMIMVKFFLVLFFKLIIFKNMIWENYNVWNWDM